MVCSGYITVEAHPAVKSRLSYLLAQNLKFHLSDNVKNGCWDHSIKVLFVSPTLPSRPSPFLLHCKELVPETVCTDHFAHSPAGVRDAATKSCGVLLGCRGSCFPKQLRANNITSANRINIDSIDHSNFVRKPSPFTGQPHVGRAGPTGAFD